MGKFNIKSLFVEETNTDDEVKDTTVETSNNSNIQKQIQKVLIIIKRHLANQIGFNDIKENCVKNT